MHACVGCAGAPSGRVRRCGRCYISELTKVMAGGAAAPRGTPPHARMLALVASFRRTLEVYLGEFTDIAM